MSMEFQAHVESFKLYHASLQELLSSHAGPVAADLGRRAIRVESAAKVNASQPPRAGPNSGSVPGQGPAVRTGRLRGSITWRFEPVSIAEVAVGGGGLAVEIGTNVEYAEYVEMGTSRMEARPFLVPALEAGVL